MSYYLRKTVKVEVQGRPSFKRLRSVLTSMAKHVDPEGRVTVKEAEQFHINSDPVTVTVEWTEWS